MILEWRLKEDFWLHLKRHSFRTFSMFINYNLKQLNEEK